MKSQVKSLHKAGGRLLTQGLSMSTKPVCVCLCVTLYLQGSIFAERGHTLHETTHLVCHRFNDLREHVRDEVFRNSEDLKGNRNQQVNVGLGIKKPPRNPRDQISVILPLREL